jgi:hypothetical protein
VQSQLAVELAGERDPILETDLRDSRGEQESRAGAAPNAMKLGPGCAWNLAVTLARGIPSDFCEADSADVVSKDPQGNVKTIN